MNKHLLSYFVFIIFFIGPIYSAKAEIYKWIDENGKTHFSDKKVSGVGQKTLELGVIRSNWSKFDIDVQIENVKLTQQEHQNIVDGVNFVYEFFDKVLYFDIYKTVPVNILVLENREAYVNYLTHIKKEKSIWSYGIYFRQENQIVVYIRKDREKTFKTIRHEVSHAIVDTILPYAPAWLNEGLAEQMETLGRNNQGLFIEPHKINRNGVHKALTGGTLTNLTAFLKLPSHQWRHSLSDGKRSLQSHAGQFVYFLLSTRPTRDFLTRLMHNFNRGDRTISYYLVDDNYIGGVAALELKWSHWVRSQNSKLIQLF